MLTATCQRWRERRDLYRPAGETIRTAEYDVALITSDNVARAFVERHHYSASYPAARLRTGLYHRGELVGVAVLSQPASQAALEAALPFPDLERAELGRFVLLDGVPANGESWFLSRTWELARAAGFQAIVSHSDPLPRTDAAGKVVHAGHIGTIYQACSAVYVGITPRRTKRMFRDGTELSARNLSKLRKQERGWRYVVDMLVEHGAPAPSGDWNEWRERAIDAASVAVRHPGNHRYLFALDRRTRKHLPESKPYPKLTRAA